MKQTFYTMDDVKRASQAIGHHWFEPDTMRFFRSRIGRTLYGDRYFVSSEQFDDTTPRLYTIRTVNDCGAIGTLGAFQAYVTGAQAVTAIKRRLQMDWEVAQ